MAHDLFVCHASEDKDDVARPLTDVLTRRGRTVWLDELELTIGDSLRQRIDEGLRESRFGIVILSPSFFAKRWPQWELDGLAQREMLSGRKIVLPVWHRVTAEEVAAYSPPLAGRLAARTDGGLEAVADEIDAVFQTATAPPAPSGRTHIAGESAEPVFVLAPPSQHRLDDPHPVTAPPQEIWAQTAFVDVENVGAAIGFIRGSGADTLSIGSVMVRAPAAIAPRTARPVELIVSTMSPDVRLPAGQMLRFWLDYGSGDQPDRRLWAVARYNAAGGWDNLGSDNRLLADQNQALSATPSSGSTDDLARLVSRIAFATSELRGSGAELKLRRWAATFGEEPLRCIVESQFSRTEAQVRPRQAGGGWLEYAARFPEDFDGAGVVAGSHKITWQAPEEESELAVDEIRFP